MKKVPVKKSAPPPKSSARIPVKQLTSWSFSRYADYKQCPLKAKFKHIDKIQEPPNEAMARGARLHDNAAAFIKGLEKKLLPELASFKKEITAIKKQMTKKILSPIVEETWALRSDWTQTTWNDWNGCWHRSKLDAGWFEDEETFIIDDWKTGKLRPELHDDYLEQLELYALIAFKMLPHIKTVKPRLRYVDLGQTYPEEPLVYTRDEDEADLQKAWEKRVKPMMNDKVFAPRPNDKCCWCYYRKSNAQNGGGQCRY